MSIYPFKFSGYYMDTQFNIRQSYVLPTHSYLCVLCGSENKRRLFPYTTLTDWFLQARRRVFTARYELNSYIQFRLLSVCMTPVHKITAAVQIQNHKLLAGWLNRI